LHTGDMVGNYNANYEIDVVSQFKDFLDWILAHDCFQSWTPPPHFSEDTKKLILRPAMTEKQFFRGLSPLVFADRDQTEIQLLANEQRTSSKQTTRYNSPPLKQPSLKQKHCQCQERQRNSSCTSSTGCCSSTKSLDPSSVSSSFKDDSSITHCKQNYLVS
jgi:hypothetical protein